MRLWDIWRLSGYVRDTMLNECLKIEWPIPDNWKEMAKVMKNNNYLGLVNTCVRVLDCDTIAVI